MTTPSGGIDIAMLGVGLSTAGVAEGIFTIEQIPAATVKAAKGLDDLGNTSEKAAEKVKKVGNAADEAAKKVKDAERAQAAYDRAVQKTVDEATRFTSALRIQAETMGMSEAALLRMKAAQMGVLADVDGYIKAIEHQTTGLKALEYAAYRTMEANESLWLKTTRAAEYSIAKQMEAEEAASLRRQALRKADEAALEAHLAKELALTQKATTARERAANAQMIANDQVSEKKRKAAEDAIKHAEKTAMEEVRWAQMSAKGKYDELVKFQALQAKGVSQGTLDGMFSKTAQNDIANTEKYLKQYLDTLGHHRRAQIEGAGHNRTFAESWEQVRFGAARTRSEMIVLANEMMQGRFTRIPSSLMVFAEYSNLSAVAASGLGLSIMGVAAAAAVYMYAIIGAEAQTKKLNDALNRSNEVSGLTAAGLTNVANAAGKLHGNYSDAYEASAKLAASGKFTAEQLQGIIPVVTEMEHVFSGSLNDSIKEFETLIVRSSTKGIQSALGVSRALLDLNDKYHFLQVAQLEQILTLEKEGKMREASALAIKLYTAEGQRAADEAKKYMGTMQKLWHDLLGSIQRGKQALLDFGKVVPNNSSQKLQAEEAIQLAVINKARTVADPNFSAAGRAIAIANAEAKLLTIRKDMLKVQEATDKASAKQRAQDEGSNILRLRAVEDAELMKRSEDILKQELAKHRNQTKLIREANPDYKTDEAGMKYLADREAAIIKKHSVRVKKEPKGSSAEDKDGRLAAMNADADAEYALIKKTVENNERLTKSAMKSGVVTQETGYAQMREGRNQEIIALESWYNKQIAILDKFKRKKDAKLREDIENKFAAGMEAIGNRNGQDEADRIEEEAQAHKKLVEMLDRDHNKSLEQLDKAIEKQRQQNSEIGKTKEQVEIAQAARDSAAAASMQTEADALSDILNNKTVELTAKETELYAKRLEFLNQAINKRRELSGLETEGAELIAMSPEQYGKDADKAAKQWQNAGNTIAKSLGEAFGKGGKAAGDMFKAFAQGQQRQLELNKQLVSAQAAAVGKKDEAFLKEQAQSEYNAQSARSRMDEYGNMASSAAGFFDEQSKGYRALMAVSQVFHAAELAMSIAELVPKATAAILNQGSGDPYTAFGRMAAMAAVVAGLGVAVGAVGGGGSGGKSAADVQKAQATGGVFGDSEAKSNSIARSIEKLTGNSIIGLEYSAGQLASLRNIESSMRGVANLLIRTKGLTEGTNMGIVEGKVKSGDLKDRAIGGTIGSVIGLIGGPLGSIIGGAIGDVLSRVWGSTKRNIVDSGVGFGGSVRDLQAGKGYNQYASVDTTKSSWFGLSKKTSNSVETQGLDDGLSKQFAMVFTNLEDSLKIAAIGMGLEAKNVSDALDSLTLATNSVSLKGLKGEELSDALNNIMSAAMDEMAAAAFKDFDQFSEVGEGYAETVMRVANGVQLTRQIFEIMGKDLGKTGLEAAKFSEHLIKTAGGVEQLSSRTQAFLEGFYTPAEQLVPITNAVAKAMSGLNLASVTTTESFRDVALASLDGTEAGNALFASLIELAPAFLKVQKAEEERYNASLDLQMEIATLEKDEVGTKRILGEQRRIELKAMDATLRPLQERIWMLKDEEAALAAISEVADERNEKNKAQSDKVFGNLDTAFNAVKTAVDRNKKALKDKYDFEEEAIKLATTSRVDSLKDQLKKAQDLKAEIKSVFDMLGNALKGTQIESAKMDKARREEAQRYLASLRGTDLTKADGLKGALEDLGKPSKAMFGSFIEYARDQARTAQMIRGLQNGAGADMDKQQLQIDAINATIAAVESSSKQQLAALKAQYEKDLKEQEEIMEKAQVELDVLKGIHVGILSLGDALKAFASAGQAVKDFQATPGGANDTALVGKLYKDLLGREGEKAGIDFWTNAMAKGATANQVIDGFMSSAEMKLRTGTQLLSTAPTLMSSLTNPQANSEALVSEIKSLRKEVVDLRVSNSAENTAIQRDTATSATKLKRIEATGIPTREVEL